VYWPDKMPMLLPLSKSEKRIHVLPLDVSGTYASTSTAVAPSNVSDGAVTIVVPLASAVAPTATFAVNSAYAISCALGAPTSRHTAPVASYATITISFALTARSDPESVRMLPVPPPLLRKRLRVREVQTERLSAGEAEDVGDVVDVAGRRCDAVEAVRDRERVAGRDRGQVSAGGSEVVDVGLELVVVRQAERSTGRPVYERVQTCVIEVASFLTGSGGRRCRRERSRRR
jgi:hypothetical protein